jgi:hypothetical protein
MTRDKKSLLLGMNFGTVRFRLDRDLLFKLAMALGYKCFHCGKELTRETFSIEHKKPWALQSNPKESFFDLDNIDFSHAACNHGEMIGRRRLYPDAAARKRAQSKRNWDRMSAQDKVESRHRRYLQNGH